MSNKGKYNQKESHQYHSDRSKSNNHEREHYYAVHDYDREPKFDLVDNILLFKKDIKDRLEKRSDIVTARLDLINESMKQDVVKKGMQELVHPY